MKTWTVWTAVAVVGCALAVGGCAGGDLLTADELAKLGLVVHWKAQLSLNEKAGEQVTKLTDYEKALNDIQAKRLTGITPKLQAAILAQAKAMLRALASSRSRSRPMIAAGTSPK